MRSSATPRADDPKHWRDRAQEARARAGELNDPVAKRQMLGIARGYDRLAKRAEIATPRQTRSSFLRVAVAPETLSDLIVRRIVVRFQACLLLRLL